ncbi:MAG TPA: hypothetical protein VMS08_03025 [Candidatus Saccharimonadia bacterium]|nr:hypothetical protein [Candidatus Saccharimonadia bacterium]
MRKRSEKPKHNKLWIPVVVALIVALVAIGLWTTRKPAVKAVTVTPSPQQSTAVDAGPSHNATPTPMASATPISNPSHPVSSTLAKPTETLNNDGGTTCGSEPCGEDSTCNSVPGATCYIEAVKGSQTIEVTKPQVTDSGGGVDMPWNADQLSGGTWSIEAVATYNGSQGISDPDQLTVE